jgi:hypothetical protein
MNPICPECRGTGRKSLGGYLTANLCFACAGDGKLHDLYYVSDSHNDYRVVRGQELALSAWAPGGRVVDYWTGEVIRDAEQLA